MPYNENQPNLVSLKRRYAESRRPIAFWVGAGLSRDAGLPDWKTLRDALADEADEQLLTLEPGEAKRLEPQVAAARENVSLWSAFSTLKEILGDATYIESIRSRFERASELEIPEIYKSIWRLKNVGGLLNLNIDRLATRAHRLIRPDEDCAYFVGRQAPEYAHHVSQRKPFIADLHGEHQSHQTWVFTEEEIKRLLSSPAYNTAISFIFGNMHVVFVGISADDIAAGGILEKLTTSGVDTGSHYWITSRRDRTTDKWANAAGIMPIRYEPEGKDHSSVLQKMFKEIDEFKTFDPPPPVVLAPESSANSLPSNDELRMLTENELRQTLASYAKTIIISNGNTTDSNAYAEFLEQYAPRIHQSWHITDVKPHNKFFDYDVVERISNGPFAGVWRVIDANGESAALKVLQMDNLRKGPQLESFRRGVQSLGFLTKHNVAGTAKLRNAYEIPTAIVMDFVEGDNLTSVVHHSSYSFWSCGVHIILNLCAHLRQAHDLEEGVLHRDVRPSNVMVPYYYWGDAAKDAGKCRFDVSLLNYDMSWHKDASGKTISGNVQESGYYAPEQLSSTAATLARSIKVDSYGVGMTLYYAVTKQSPPIGGRTASEWPNSISRIRSEGVQTWRSATARLRRIIDLATAGVQSDRPTVAEIETQLRTILDALEGRQSMLTPDLWAEELLCQTVGADYEVDERGSRFSRELRAGRMIQMTGRLATNTIELIFRNQALASTEWSGTDRIWPAKLETARAMLKAQGWTIKEGTRYASQEIHLIAEIHISQVRGQIPKIRDGLNKAIDIVRLE